MDIGTLIKLCCKRSWFLLTLFFPEIVTGFCLCFYFYFLSLCLAPFVLRRRKHQAEHTCRPYKPAVRAASQTGDFGVVTRPTFGQTLLWVNVLRDSLEATATTLVGVGRILKSCESAHHLTQGLLC